MTNGYSWATGGKDRTVQSVRARFVEMCNHVRAFWNVGQWDIWGDQGQVRLFGLSIHRDSARGGKDHAAQATAPSSFHDIVSANDVGVNDFVDVVGAETSRKVNYHCVCEKVFCPLCQPAWNGTSARAQ